MTKKLDLEDKIIFTGRRNDVPKLVKISNIAISTSRQEGLPVNIMEAMLSNLPIVATNCRGNRDLIKNGENGYLVNINDVDNFATFVEKIYNNNSDLYKVNNKKIINDYLLDSVLKDIEKIYDQI